jgi:agmatine deiminase
MPAEWETQVGTWVSWPHNVETWPENLLAAQAEFVAFVKAIAVDQPAIVMTPASELEKAKSFLAGHDNVSVLQIETNDAWARDYAPTFVVDRNIGETVSVDWHYNAWGGKYPPFDADQKVASSIATHLGIRNVDGGLCLEGGAIEMNSAGVLLTTESCVLNPNRNPGKSKRDAETILRERLGCLRVVWLPGESETDRLLQGDDTDGHIDQLARFVNDTTLVYAAVDKNDPRRSAAELNLSVIEKALPDVERVPLKIPKPFSHCGRTIPASYCNFLITNGSVIVPQFDVPEDSAAVERLADLFEGRKIVPLPSRNLSVGLGSFHCLSQQQPAVSD